MVTNTNWTDDRPELIDRELKDRIDDVISGIDGVTTCMQFLYVDYFLEGIQELAHPDKHKKFETARQTIIELIEDKDACEEYFRYG